MLDVIDLATAARGRLDSLPTGIGIYDGRVPTAPPDRYVVYFPDAGNARDARYVRTPQKLGWGCSVVCVGRSPLQAIGVAQQVRILLAGWRPDPDLTASPLSESDLGAQVLRDDVTATDVRFSFTLQFRLTTTRSLNG